jgi:Rrf2 family iron-sulfur cluster assembly transcriptional regulator
MRLTTKGRFAVAAMLDMAENASDRPINLGILSQRQNVSLSYLEALFSRLRRHELVASTRGPGGGYALARDASKITVADILFAVDGPVPPTRDIGRRTAPSPGRVTTMELWASLGRQVVDYLDSVTLQSLVRPGSAQRSQMREMLEARLLANQRRAKPRMPKGPNSVFALGQLAAQR